MKKSELKEKTAAVKIATRDALQIMYDNMNQGQRKKIIKVESVKILFDRYGVQY